jgi:UDP-N-acetylmuramoyl-tripeptide--D-alanyl-D-alanine ligase
MSLPATPNFWSPEQVRATTGGTLVARFGDGLQEQRKMLPFTGVSIDSRTVQPGQCFVALKGPRHDGHAYVRDVLKAGATFVIIERADAFDRTMLEGVTQQANVVVVQSTHQALLQLAAAYRKLLTRTRVIAVAGSNGKTTTVRLIDAALGGSGVLKGTASKKSFNNSIGVPLTILQASPLDQYLICEVGTNAPGELQPLSHVIQPDIAVITSLGREHLEGLGSLEGVAAEEACIVSGLNPSGFVVLPADAPMLVQAVQVRLARGAGVPSRALVNGARTPDHAAQLMTFGVDAEAQIRVEQVEETDGGVSFALSDRTAYRVPLLGRHNAMNATAAAIVARRCGLTQAQIAAGLATVQAAEMRLQLSKVVAHGGEAPITVLNDSYNANPDSMLAALSTLRAIVPGLVASNAPHETRVVGVLGEMLELGEAGPAAHAEIAEAALASGVQHLVLVGELFRRVAQQLRAKGTRVDWFLSTTAHAKDIAKQLRGGDVVLLKGSRGTAMERVVKELPQHRDAGAVLARVG